MITCNSLIFFFFFTILKKHFVFGCIGSSLLCAGSHWGGFSCCGAKAVGAWATGAARGLSSCCGAQALGHAGFSSCGTQAQ